MQPRRMYKRLQILQPVLLAKPLPESRQMLTHSRSNRSHLSVKSSTSSALRFNASFASSSAVAFLFRLALALALFRSFRRSMSSSLLIASLEPLPRAGAGKGGGAGGTMGEAGEVWDETGPSPSGSG